MDGSLYDDFEKKHKPSIFNKVNIMLFKWNRALDLLPECTNPNTTFGSVFGGRALVSS